MKSQDDGHAEAVYAGFVQLTTQLAEVGSRRTQLQAQKAFIDDLIALSEDRAKRLQADLDVACTQQAKVNDYQSPNPKRGGCTASREGKGPVA
jgi:RecA/RadA recombinase